MQPSTLLPPRLLASPFPSDALPSGRLWQGIPSLERSPRGRLFTVFYSGMSGEQSGNFVVLAASDDDGLTWTDPVLVVRHEDPQMRVFDPNVWLDPLGRLWLTWAQSRGLFDGRDGAWAVRCDRPDDPGLRWSAPRRIVGTIYDRWYLVYRDLCQICDYHWFGGVEAGQRDTIAVPTHASIAIANCSAKAPALARQRPAW